jgi:hypothetical protein
MNGVDDQGQVNTTVKERTFAMNPQQRISRVPFLENVAFYQPCRSSLVVRM